MIMHSGISATALVTVVLNLLFNEVRAGSPGASVFAASEDHRDTFGDRLDDDIPRAEESPGPAQD